MKLSQQKIIERPNTLGFPEWNGSGAPRRMNSLGYRIDELLYGS
jgi:hypothetical protein